MSETRARIERFIDANPGVHFSEVARALDLATGQVQYHLARLDGVVTEAINGRTHHYTAGFDPWERHALAYLRRETPRELIVRLLDADGAAVRPQTVTGDLGIARSTLEHHVDGLVAAGVVVKDHDAGTVRLRLRRPAATAALLRVVEPAAATRVTDRFERLVDAILEDG